MAVMAGYKTPTWVYADGAQTFKFLWDTADDVTGRLQRPVDSAPVGSGLYGQMASLHPGAGRAVRREPDVVSVPMYGINFRSVENSSTRD